jgi:hypothetical protein
MNPERLEELEALFDSNLITPSPYHQRDIFRALKDESTPSGFKTKAILFLRKHKNKIDIEELSFSLGVSPKDAESILNNEISAAFFPIANDTQAKLSKLYIIKIFNSKPISIKNGIDDALTVIKNLTKTSFFIMFDDDFMGNSFMLASFTALMFFGERALENYSFSGVVDHIGNVLKVEYLNKKGEISSHHSKYLIDSTIIKNVKQLNGIIKSKFIDIPFCIALKPSPKNRTPKEAAMANLYEIAKKIDEDESHLSFESVKNLYRLNDDNFVYYTEERFLPESDWSKYIKEAHSKIKNLKFKIKEKIAVIHFSILGPATFAFGIGALIGSKEPFVTYHYDSGKYEKVLDLRNTNGRILKQIKANSDNLECFFEKNISDTLSLVYYLSSENPVGEAKTYIKENFTPCSILSCKLKNYQGNLPIEDWSKYINEMYKIYNETKNSGYKKRLFFFSIPVAIAFGFGAAIETFENGDVFNLNKNSNTYTLVFNLKNLSFNTP